MLIIGGLFALALVALVIAIFMAREDKPQAATAPAEASAPASEEVKISAEEKEVTWTPAQEETIVAPAPVAQAVQNNKQTADVVQPILNEIVSPVEDGQNTESLYHTQGQLQELIAMMRQLQGQIQTLEHRVSYISTQMNHLNQSDEPNTGATFVDIPALPRNRHP